MIHDELLKALEALPPAPAHPTSWMIGWGLVLAGFASGAALGLGFHRPDFLGGYGSFERRLLRLGHVALVALGMMNVLYGISPWPSPGSTAAAVAGSAFAVGGVAMPATCALVAWCPALRHLFALPVAALVAAAAACLAGVPA